MTKKFLRNRNTWVAYILLAVYAYFLNIPGPITPFLRDEFHLSYTVSSLHFSAFAVGILVVGLAGHAVIHHIGRWQALSIGAIGLGSGALLLAFGRTPLVTIAAAFLMGGVGSLILAVVPAALSEEHGEMRAMAISEANVLSSLISATAPFLVGRSANLMVGWRFALIIVALPAILAGVILFKPGRPRETGARAVQSRRGLPPLFWFYWTCIVLAVSVEFCMIYWSANYMESELGMSRTSAAQSVSLFLAGMIVGRLVSTRLLQDRPARKVVLASILLGMLGFTLYWTATSALLGMISLTITGLGVASLYPSILSMAIGAAHGDEAQAGARATLASGMAILILPLFLGRLADIVGIKAAFAVVAVLFTAMFSMMLFAGRIAPDSFAAKHGPGQIDCCENLHRVSSQQFRR